MLSGPYPLRQPQQEAGELKPRAADPGPAVVAVCRLQRPRPRLQFGICSCSAARCGGKSAPAQAVRQPPHGRVVTAWKSELNARNEDPLPTWDRTRENQTCVRRQKQQKNGGNPIKCRHFHVLPPASDDDSLRITNLQNLLLCPRRSTAALRPLEFWPTPVPLCRVAHDEAHHAPG